MSLTLISGINKFLILMMFGAKDLARFILDSAISIIKWIFYYKCYNICWLTNIFKQLQ